VDQAAPRRHFPEELLRSVESLRFGPFWLALVLSAAILALFLVWCGLFGRLDDLFGGGPSLRPARTTIVLAFLTAFLFVTRRYEIRKAPEDWAPLQPVTGLSAAEFGRLVQRGSARTPLAWGVTGAATGLAVLVFSRGAPQWILRGEAWSALLVWTLAINVVLFVMMARAAYASLRSRELNDRIAAEIVRVDLLDTAPLRCFSRQGLRRAFYWAGGSSIASLLGLELEQLWPLFAILGLTLGLAGFALLDPIRVVHRRISDAKRDELDRVRERIRATRSELLGGSDRAAQAAAGLPGLLAYEARIASVSAWAFDTSTLVRFAALALLATGSWLGGAVAERLLDVALE
jgi:hypothetical protein